MATVTTVSASGQTTKKDYLLRSPVRSLTPEITTSGGRQEGAPLTRFSRDSPLEESGFEPSVPLLRKFLPGCCRKEIPERLAGVPY
jgi:hypothetical protein